VLRLHFADVAATEMEMLENVPVTTALRTILDVWREKSPPESSLRKAFEDATRLGKLTKGQVAQALKDPGVARVCAGGDQRWSSLPRKRRRSKVDAKLARCVRKVQTRRRASE
jgi:hypothetical protein